jgi:hypothetical protein
MSRQLLSVLLTRYYSIFSSLLNELHNALQVVCTPCVQRVEQPNTPQLQPQLQLTTTGNQTLFQPIHPTVTFPLDQDLTETLPRPPPTFRHHTYIKIST